MQPWPDNARHIAASLPDLSGATRRVGDDNKASNRVLGFRKKGTKETVATPCDSTQRRAAVLLVRPHGHDLVLGQRYIQPVQGSFHPSNYLAQSWLRNAVVVEAHRGNPPSLGLRCVVAWLCRLCRRGRARNIRAMVQEAAGNADHTNDASVANAQDTGQRQSDYVIREG